MNTRLIRRVVLLSLGLCTAMDAVGASAITVTSMGGNTTFVTGGSGTANFSVKVDSDIQPKNTPLQLYFMDKNGGHYASQITSGVSACTGIPTVCGNPISLSAGQQCCLQLALDGSQLPPKTYILKAFVGTKPDVPNSVYNGQASDLPITVTSQPLTTTLAVDNPTKLPRVLSVNCRPSSSCATTQSAALTGNPRTITIKNTGSNPAYLTTVTPSGLPAGTTITSDTCANTTLAPGGTCLITITPGDNASSNCTTGITPTPGTITVSATNAVALNPGVVVLSYGCIYQGGYVYVVDDTYPDAPITGNITGKVVAISDNATGNGNTWWNGSYTTTGATSFYDGSNVAPNGNTYKIINNQGTGTYAATTCAAYLADSSGATCSPVGPDCFGNWYLPAICEMGPASNGSGCTAGTPNMVDNLPELLGGSCTFGSPHCLQSNSDFGQGYYWSSTESSLLPQEVAWLQFFGSGGSSFQTSGGKFNEVGVRCSRALTL